MNKTVQKGFSSVVILVVIVIVVATFGGWYWYITRDWKVGPGLPPSWTTPPATPTLGDSLLYSKKASWGPCPPGGVCFQDTYLYSSGKLIVNNPTKEKLLDKNIVEQIKTYIRDSGIMNKECKVNGTIVDYSATYNIYLDGKQKTIQFDGCQDILDKIYKLIEG